ncbi:hypothetical protein EWM64_g9088 [Hericium alpestre]|uniref:Uncharacterized protein n=1 Tax=Hericium alpestre TaxID=135208 RepID=A0A4Y9ZK10_9AGAM|nr:hypothetical protein EWM64_g9088 [Hericium alpestre]
MKLSALLTLIAAAIVLATPHSESDDQQAPKAPCCQFPVRYLMLWLYQPSTLTLLFP